MTSTMSFGKKVIFENFVTRFCTDSDDLSCGLDFADSWLKA